MQTESVEKQYITEKEAAALTGLSRQWFSRARWEGNGPKFIKLGNAVRYDLGELHAWLKARERTNTGKVS